jgi:hypothetical protein
MKAKQLALGLNNPDVESILLGLYSYIAQVEKNRVVPNSSGEYPKITRIKELVHAK